MINRYVCDKCGKHFVAVKKVIVKYCPKCSSKSIIKK